MPSRLRQAAGQSATVAQDEGRYNISGLGFNQALTWRAGKALPVADLLSRLQALGTELRGLEQGQIPAKEFRQLAQDLAHSNLLGHKDKGIRAWALCCIVDILNICAPDAPFNPGQLRDIFKVVNNLFQNLDDPSNAYNAQHVYILNSLTDTKSIVLVTDLEKSDELITPLFRTCFDIVSGATQKTNGQELAKSVEFQLRSMLVTIIDEANLPQDAIDIILSQFLRVDPRTQQEPGSKNKKQDVKDKRQDTLHLKDYPPAYNMAKTICTTCIEKMTAYVTQYVGTIIMNASAALKEEVPPKHHGRKASEVEDSDNEDDDSQIDLKKAHRLVRELWRACPDVLINVIPQIEAELHADSTLLRQLATETLGDIIAGIGISGLPPTTSPDPCAYPLPSIDEPTPAQLSTNPLLVPASPKPFASIHSSAYSAFLGRRVDKSPLVRNVWAIAASRILVTDAGGIGMSSQDRDALLSSFVRMLQDQDDKVRHTAVQSIGHFDYHATLNVLAADGGLSSAGTVFSALADRLTDKKHNVQEDAMSLLAQIWGTASRDIQNAVRQVVDALGNIPSRICNAMYVNDLNIHMQIYKSLYETLLPIGFPPVKAGSKGESQKKGKAASQSLSNMDPDSVRVQRILVFVQSLDQKARQVFFGIQKQQVDMSKVVKVFLKACEDYNGGVVDDDEEEQKLKEQLTKYIQGIARLYPDPGKASTELWKFVKMHDRRNYQLIRFATEPEHDYRTMSKAIKELTKRIKEGPPSTQIIMETLMPLLYRSALIVYNRSHVPAIMEISRTDEGELADIAQEVLKEISARNPEVLKTHIQALCKELEDNAPTASKEEPVSPADTLKACAGFARKYPADVPKDRKFLTAMTNFALYSQSARAAKHAVTILLTVSDKKELHAKELISKAVKDCDVKSAHYLARLATISQVCLLAPAAAAVEEDAILKIVVADCLQKNQSPENREDQNAWEVPDTETLAKELSLKVMVNRCRSADEKANASAFDLLANSVISILVKLVENDGEITTTEDTPLARRNYIRLVGARYILKLCSHKRRCEELVTPKMFISVATTVINPPYPVRSTFIQQAQKYLSRSSLHARWYTPLFLLAFEPDVELKSRSVAWLKSRVSFHERHQKYNKTSSADKSHQAVMENVLSRFLSLLTHHPDYPDPESESFEAELLDFARYIVFYLQCVASEDNISLIFHISQRVKQTQDAVQGTDEVSERLYVLSDLAQAVIRNFADLMPAHAKGVNLLQTWPGKVALPTSLFAALPSHSVAQEIAAKNYLPEDVALGLEKLVRIMVRGVKARDKTKTTTTSERKRKSDSVDLDDSDGEKKIKKVRKSSTLPIRKTPKSAKRKVRDGEMSTEQPSRKSARTSAVKNYAESDDDDDEEMEYAVESSPIKPTKTTSVTKNRTRVSKTQEVEDKAASEDTQSEPEVEAESAQDEDVEMAEHVNGDHDTENVDEGQDEAEKAAPADPDVEDTISNDQEAEAEDAEAENIDEDEVEEPAEEDAEDDDEEMEGTPSPQPKPTRATRSRGGARTNNTSKETPSKATAPATSSSTSKAKSKSNEKTTPKAPPKSKSKSKSRSKAETEAVAEPTEKDGSPAPAPAPAPASAGRSTRATRNTSATATAVSKLNATAGSKGKSKAKRTKKDDEETVDPATEPEPEPEAEPEAEPVPAPAPASAPATRRSARNR